MLDTYYPPDQFSCNLDIDFDTWSRNLQSTPYPINADQGNATFRPVSDYSFNYTSNMPTSSHFSSQQMGPWQGMWSHSNLPPQASSSPYATGYEATELQQQHSASTLTMGTPSADRFGFSTSEAQQGVVQPAFQHQYPVPQEHSAAYSLPSQGVTAEQQRKQNSELNFGMGVYQQIPRGTR